MQIEFAPRERLRFLTVIEELVLRNIRSPEAFITDESTFYDFSVFSSDNAARPGSKPGYFVFEQKVLKRELDVSEQKIIGRMREARRDGVSLHAIARALTSEGVPTKNGGRWYAKSISQILECNARLAAEHKRQIGRRTELNRK